MVRLSKIEVILWAVLVLVAGCMVGMCVDALLNIKPMAKAACENGTSEQTELQATYNFATGEYSYSPIRKKTYISANDTCEGARK